MKAIVEMAKAHLQNVETKIQELNSQKELIQDQINKLSQYLSEGKDLVSQEESKQS